ncbi:MAG: 2-phosphosulfolactate phosphatase [Suipraeoptans sp.]
MKINILQMISGAKAAKGLTVIIDVFRAFTVECVLADKGAGEIIAVASKELAYRLKEDNPEYILIGERDGIMLPGFDFGNSPSQIAGADLKGKVIVHTTSAGTQGIENAKNASEIITGSLVNADAIIEYITTKKPEEVSLVCMGLNAKSETQEDTLLAEYIRAGLMGETLPGLKERLEDLKYTSGAKFFDKNKLEFPEEDFYLSTDMNKYDFVLKLDRKVGGLNYIKKCERGIHG